MPVSKRRKATTKKRVPKVLVRKPVVPAPKDKWTIKLHASRIIQLRNDPDFLTMIKIGRVSNALSFCLNDIRMSEDEKTLVKKLQHRRASFVLAGYVHEAVTVIDRIKGPYLGEPAFERLRICLLDPQHRKVRRYARKLRNCMAFHLDEIDETTRPSLAALEATTHTIMSADLTFNPVPVMYFELADYLDMAYMVSEFADGRSWDETVEDIIWGINKYAHELRAAIHEFNLMLWTTKFAKHAY